MRSRFETWAENKPGSYRRRSMSCYLETIRPGSWPNSLTP